MHATVKFAFQNRNKWEIFLRSFFPIFFFNKFFFSCILWYSCLFQIYCWFDHLNIMLNFRNVHLFLHSFFSYFFNFCIAFSWFSSISIYIHSKLKYVGCVKFCAGSQYCSLSFLLRINFPSFFTLHNIFE